MGIGRYRAGKLDLIVSFKFSPTAADLSNWLGCFTAVSAHLHGLTGGTVQLRNLRWVADTAGVHVADVYISETAPIGSSSQHSISGLGYDQHLGQPDLQVTLPNSWWSRQNGVTHEFMHYLFDHGDEYGSSDVPPKPGCLQDIEGTPPDTACLLEKEAANGLCTTAGSGAATSHMSADDATGGDQQVFHQMSCRDWLDNLLTPPGPYTTSVALGNVSWVPLDSRARTVLVLDRSGSMTGDPIAGVRDSAHYWLDHSNAVAQTAVDAGRPERLLGMISYNTTQQEVLALTQLPLTAADLTTELTNILTTGDLDAGGLTNIGGSLDDARVRILGPVPPSAAQSLVALTDGLHNDPNGQPPSGAVLDQLVDDWVRVFTLGYSDSADANTLQNIAKVTKGEYLPMTGAPGSLGAHTILDGFVKAAGDDSSGFIVHQSVTVGAEPVRIDVPVERGADYVSFVVTYLRGAQVALQVFDEHDTQPSGPSVIPSNSSDVPYDFVVVGAPEPGDWYMLVSPVPGAPPPGDVTVWAISGNGHVSVGVSGHQQVYELDEPVELRIRAHHQFALSGLDAPTVRFPELDRQPEARAEESPPGSGTYFARIEGLPEGSHRAEIVVENDGRAVSVVDPTLEPDGDLPDGSLPFRRIRTVHIHVGRLGEGEDTDPRDEASV
ncbi:MAG: vWA domain-containing protein [Ilumatobacter sp.]|uniref:vWA domain-containing protein n=1 Tax=Ilumatobacter sp. TaxID=1967498 RepID=UPI0026092F74|nr:vWA domain-containing protein [Ilumatobacter sp.]MDJ0768763.1 vWA domain-containing protein [Ilumatobacter sp.]